MTYQYQSDKDLKPKQKTYQIGIYKPAKQSIDSTFKPEVSLKELRLARDNAQDLLSDGVAQTMCPNLFVVSTLAVTAHSSHLR